MRMKKTEACGDRELSIEFLARVAEVLRLLAHPHRLKIVELLEGTDGLPVHAITDRLGLAHAATSQHLNRMRRAGVLKAVRFGREVRYRIADERSISILDCIRKRRAVA